MTLQDELFQYVDSAHHNTLHYRQAMTLYALAYMCQNLKLPTRAVAIANSAIEHFQKINSAPGDPDHETHLQGRLQCLSFLCSLRGEVQGSASAAAQRVCSEAVEVAEGVYAATRDIHTETAQTLIDTLAQLLPGVEEAFDSAGADRVHRMDLLRRISRIRDIVSSKEDLLSS